nr:hypothetical protein [Halorussus pelagicus]
MLRELGNRGVSVRYWPVQHRAEHSGDLSVGECGGTGPVVGAVAVARFGQRDRQRIAPRLRSLEVELREFDFVREPVRCPTGSRTPARTVSSRSACALTT